MTTRKSIHLSTKSTSQQWSHQPKNKDLPFGLTNRSKLIVILGHTFSVIEKSGSYTFRYIVDGNTHEYIYPLNGDSEFMLSCAATV